VQVGLLPTTGKVMPPILHPLEGFRCAPLDWAGNNRFLSRWMLGMSPVTIVYPRAVWNMLFHTIVTGGRGYSWSAPEERASMEGVRMSYAE
jgi:hypothetical protein